MSNKKIPEIIESFAERVIKNGFFSINSVSREQLDERRAFLLDEIKKYKEMRTLFNQQMEEVEDIRLWLESIKNQ